MKLWLSLILALIIALPARAEPYTYNPEGCGFEITFPSEPETVERCNEYLTDRCERMTSFTHVFDVSVTLNVYVTCKSADEQIYADFNEDVMRTTLIARAANRLETFDTYYDFQGQSKVAALLGAGDSPNSDDMMVYMAQLWVAKDSLLTLESELLGPQHDDAERMFAEILRSIRHRDETPAGGGPQLENSAPGEQ